MLKHNPMKLHYTLLAIGLSLLVLPLYGQFTTHEPPISQTYTSDLPALRPQTLPALNLQRIVEQDADGPGIRFAAPLPTDLDLERNGQWTDLPDGGRLWRLELTVPGALGLAVFYDVFDLPPGAKLFMYTPGYEEVLGAYTSHSRSELGRSWTGFTTGATTIVEYYEPASQRGRGQLHIFRVDQAYDAAVFEQGRSSLMFGFGTAAGCHINANCTQSNGWEEQQKSTCRIIMALEEGTGYCTGTLMNNTSEDGTPYILTAYHCQDGFTPLYDLWRFDFNYEGANCTNPGTEPTAQSILGCTYRSGRGANDFLLLETFDAIPDDFDAYFAGWNRQAVVPQQGAVFHHPSGDIKKMSLYDEPAVVFPNSLDWGPVTTPANHHYELEYSEGSFQPGSSGSTLLNEHGQVVGQLQGGFNPACTGVAKVYFGRLSLSWSPTTSADTRLSDWLDPLNLGVDSLGGLKPQAAEIKIDGHVRNTSGAPVGQATVVITAGQLLDTTYTDTTGYYTFSGIPVGIPTDLSLSREEDAAANGVSTFDIILASRHALGVQPFDTPYQFMAADVNNSQTITPLDQIGIRRVVLSLDLAFPDRPMWQFFPAAYVFPDPVDDTVPTVFSYSDLQGDTTIDFIGVKTGDVDGNAETNNLQD